MKRPFWVIAVSTLSLAVIAFGSYSHWAKATFVSREIKHRTGATKVLVLEEFHGEDQWYGKVEIDPETGNRLLRKYEWNLNFKKDVALAGKLASAQLEDCPDCFYRVTQDPHDAQFHPYDYTVYVLNPDLKRLEVYEAFGS